MGPIFDIVWTVYFLLSVPYLGLWMSLTDKTDSVAAVPVQQFQNSASVEGVKEQNKRKTKHLIIRIQP